MKKYILFFTGILYICNAFAQATIIGTTSYDVQTNNGAKHRIKVYDDGKISAIWTGSTDYTFIPPASPADRGMFINNYDGTSWGPYPTTRLETVKTGFGDICRVQDHEVVVAHDGINLRLFANTELGGTTWTELGGSGPGYITGFWPTTASPAGTDTLYVVNVDANPPTELRFSRSDDGGNTWAILNYTLPFLTSTEGIPSLSLGLSAAETYQIAAKGSDVYVLFGMQNSDLVLLHSNDYGNDGTWESTVILDFPIDNYTGSVQSDIDGDGITDTIATTDGYYNMIMEDDGTLQVFAGYYRLYSDLFAGFWTVNWRAMGIWHWKTGMASAEVINTEIDWSNCDTLNNPYAGLGAAKFQYRSAGNSSMPGAAWDPETGRIYLIYTNAIEYTDIYDDPANLSAQSRRDIFGMYSDDDGATWSQPNNLTNSAEAGKENVYAFVNDRVVDGKVSVIWQQDTLPGTALADIDPVDTNYIWYASWGESDFTPVLPVSAFTSSLASLTATFTNTTTDANCYSWNFGDGATSTETNPVHTYAVAGIYSVCLTATNPYGSVEYCANVTIDFAPVADFSFTGDPTVDFTDLSTYTPTSWSWDFGDGDFSTLQNPSHTYTVNGFYNVCLTAANAAGSNTTCKTVGINFSVVAPVADFTYIVTGYTVSFTDISTNSPVAWAWDFDDGGSSALQNPVYTYAAAGNYNVCLTATNAGGATTKCYQLDIVTSIQNNLDQYVTVYPNPADNFVTIKLSSQLINSTIELYDIAGNKIQADILKISNDEIQINSKQLNAGTYIIKILNNSGAINRELIIE